MIRLTIIGVLLVSFSSFCQEVKISRELKLQGIELTEDAVWFTDSSGKYGVEDVLRKRPTFSPQKKPAGIYPFNPKPVWVRCALENRGHKERTVYVLVENLRIEYLKLYALKSDSSVLQFPATGWGYPLNQRPYPFYRHSFPLKIKAGETVTLYLWSQTWYHPINIPVSIIDYSLLVKKTSTTVLGDGVVICTTFLVFLISLFLLVESGFRNRMFLWYSVYTLSIFLYYFLRIGILFFNSRVLHPVIDYYADIPTVICLVAYGLFSFEYLSSAKVKLSVQGLLKGMILFSGVISLVAYGVPPVPHVQAIFWTRLVLFALCVGGILYFWIMGFIQKTRDAWLYTPMFIIILTGYVITVVVSDLVPDAGLFDYFNILKLVIFFESVVMLFSVFYKNRLLRQDLFQKIAEAEKQVLTTQIEVQEAERQRIASDLHDELGASIATARRDAEELYKSDLPDSTGRIAERLRDTIATTGQDLRRITHNLMPPNFELEEALRYLVERTGEQGAIQFEWGWFGEERPLEREVEINIYRIVSELVNNILKHSGATRASVQLIYYPDMLSLQVEDNGSGFDIKGAQQGIGLHSVCARAKYIGAELRIDSGRSGTSVSMTVPLKK